jgi:Flp pilus assembly CpaE family ATPase
MVFSHGGFPTGPTDPILRQLQDLRAEVVLIDIDPLRAQRAVTAIELLKSNTNDLGIFALGEMDNPATIVAAMRAGACEYLERAGDPVSLQEALSRFASSRTHNINSAGRARVLTFMNAKGGAGATTLAVNTALALQQEHGGGFCHPGACRAAPECKAGIRTGGRAAKSASHGRIPAQWVHDSVPA